MRIEELARYPRPGLALPGKIAFSPGGRLVTFLYSPRGDLARELWSIDVATGERRVLLGMELVGGGATDSNVSREEALRRERERLRETGITHYQWAEEADVLLVPVRGDLFVMREGQLRCPAREATAPQLSPDGRLIGFVRGGDLYVVPTGGGGERRLTTDGKPGLTNGLAEYIAQEEMHRQRGFWFSRDGRFLAFEQVDERHIPPFRIPHFAKPPHEVEEHRYPFAGAENARVRVGVIAVEGGPTTWIDLGGAEYLARVAWTHDRRLLLQLQNRNQSRLDLVEVDPWTDVRRTLLVEESACWVNLHNDLRCFAGGEYLWASERTGYKHLYLYKEERLLRALTEGDWAVDAVAGTTATHVYFTAGRESPLEMHLYRVPLAGGPIERLTTEPGVHSAVVQRQGALAVTHDRRASPPRIFLRRENAPDLLLHSSKRPRLPEPELFSFPSRDGTTLYGCAYRPRRRAKRPPPIVVDVYGGPHVQNVQESWLQTVDLRAQYLASRGFLVLTVDNRGSARRGLAFESAIHRNMGTLEVSDQADGVRHAVAQGWGDGGRVGVYGWSYGGYMVLRCLALEPGLFRVGVAGAPVTEWESYDTHYTERYMDTPQANPDGYRAASVLTVAKQIRGKLLLVHGMLDENVHFRHTARLIDAFAKAGVEYDLVLYPEERHMPRGPDELAALERRIVGYFERNLK